MIDKWESDDKSNNEDYESSDRQKDYDLLHAMVDTYLDGAHLYTYTSGERWRDGSAKD